MGHSGDMGDGEDQQPLLAQDEGYARRPLRSALTCHFRREEIRIQRVNEVVAASSSAVGGVDQHGGDVLNGRRHHRRRGEGDELDAEMAPLPLSSEDEIRVLADDDEPRRTASRTSQHGGQSQQKENAIS